ncbi:sugar transferase [Sphingomicrobium sediminis]|uniref:Sugar transferase n=1 Tax=Sphingomicrobium sediminis TaxID=2950949 RepID=A0A9X2EFK9_9SPHN|nr:sugar transferase [Sphingomicrobium sediminis]MCM8556640.1 sugar transferase [Sphingomicrobium sediminis]
MSELQTEKRKAGLWQGGGKRVFDIVVSAIALVLFSPIILVVALLVALKLGRPVLFRQQRPGVDARPFEMIKFRTMRDAVDAEGKLLPDAERLTRFGSLLRKTSLDELPELWNVLKGEMSLVGPRPLLMEYVPLYSPEQARRMEVRPGVTGWAQVNGRNAIDWDEKFDLDRYYVDHHDAWMDMKILALTVLRIVSPGDVNAEGEATMRRFEGNGR